MSKREDYISWKRFFMETAIVASKRSKDPNTQVGAIIVDTNNHIVGIGYNGLPNGMSDDLCVWGKDKYTYVVHAEVNAILNSSLTKDCTLYATHFPCNECAKVIVQSGIKKVIFKNKHHMGTATNFIFNTCGVEIEQYHNLE
jgi:dCMP deaminase